jgi:hypothetical protein
MLLVVAVASFVCSAVVLACIAIIRASTKRINRSTTHTGKKPVGRFIIDGCNGPIQIKIPRRNETGGGGCNVQLWFALHPEPEKPVDLLSKLQDMCVSAVVVFDGRSQPWPFDVSERSFEWQPPPAQSSSTTTTKSSSASSPQHVGSVSVLVTCRKEEADHVIVRMVKNGMDGTPCYPTNHDHGDHDVEPLVPTILKLVRSDQGPGRQKSFLRPLGLLQSHAVACLFPHNNWSPKLNLQALQILRRLGQPAYQSLFMPQVAATEESQYSSVISIVVTDDVYLRQRVPYCMTFQQLHDFLVDETPEPQHHQQRTREEAKNK